MSALSTRVVQATADWDALAAPWAHLLAAAAAPVALQSNDFLRCWWRHMGGGLEPWIVVAFRGEELVGALPLQLARRRIWKREYRVLEFIGMPNDLCLPMLLARPGDRETVAALLEALAARRADWDLLQLDEIASDSWQLAELGGWARRHRLWCRSREFHPVPYLNKTNTWGDYLETMSGHARNRLRQAERRMARAGTLSYQHAATSAELAEIVDLFFEVESRSWKVAAGMAAGADPNYRAFCRELLTAPGSALRGHGIVQRLDGRPTAATIGFSHDGVYYSLQIAHDEAYRKFSPGTLLEAHELAWFFAEPALRRYEFLGGTVFNKRRWTDTAVASCQVFVRQPGLHIALKDFSRFHAQPALARLWRKLRRTPDETRVEPFRTG